MAKTSREIIEQTDRYVMPTYARMPLVITKAKGSRVWDAEGRQYLDLFPGWGVSALGYNHPWVMTALRGQSSRVVHISNNYYHPLQWRAAKKLLDVSFGDGSVFFCNSGAEAVEAAIKLARRWGSGRHEIIVMDRSFHGRTTGALSATGQTKYQEGFEPLLPGFVRVPFADLAAMERAVTDKTCAVLVEPIQGEGGVRVAGEAFLQGVRRLCDERNLLWMSDEVQTGIGRTGEWFGYQASGAAPDVLVLAKALGGGFPVAGIVANAKTARVLTPGTHATTYGGSPLACACILAVFEAIEKDKLLARVRSLGHYAQERLQAFAPRCPIIKEVRGRGFMIGIELSVPGQPVVDACREQRLLINCTQETVLRLLPAMTITKDQFRKGLNTLEAALTAHASGGAAAGKAVNPATRGA